jgi:hypothetical protein
MLCRNLRAGEVGTMRVTLTYARAAERSRIARIHRIVEIALTLVMLGAALVLMAHPAQAAPNFDVDGIGVDLYDPHIGVPIERIIGATYFVSFEDLPLGISDADYNDYAVELVVSFNVVNWIKIGGLSAHSHDLVVYDNPLDQQLMLGLRDRNTGFEGFTGTMQAWVQCLSGCGGVTPHDPEPSPTPEPSTYATVGAAIAMAVVRRRFAR